MTRFVFDTSLLSAFAQADAIETLHRIVDQDECLIPLAVREELARGALERRLVSAVALRETSGRTFLASASSEAVPA